MTSGESNRPRKPQSGSKEKIVFPTAKKPTQDSSKKTKQNNAYNRAQQRQKQQVRAAKANPGQTKAAKQKAIRWFFNSINSQIEPVHQRYFGADMQPSHSHTLWITLCGFVFGVIVCVFIITKSFFRFLDSTTTFFFIFITIEYTIMLRSMKQSKWPELPQDWEEYKAGTITTQLPQGKVACIIPVGWGISGMSQEQQNQRRAAKMEVLADTLDSVARVFHPSDIYVVHNSSQQRLPDLVVAKSCTDKGANYCPVAIGSKSVAVYYGGIFADRMGYSHCLIMDDDVRLDPATGVVLQQGRLDANAYAIGISAVHEDPHGRHSQWQRIIVDCQNAEYCLSDVAKLSQASWMPNATVLAPHGALSLWKTKTMIDVMRQHDGVFDGEDYQMGVILAMNTKESKCGMIARVNAATVCPESFGDLYRQRKNSWDLAAHQHLFGGTFSSPGSARYLQVICCLPAEMRTFLLRVYTAMDVWTAIQDWFRVLLIVVHIYTAIRDWELNYPVLFMYFVMFFSQWVVIWSLLRVKLEHRPDLKPSPKTVDDFEDNDLKLVILLFPFYRFILSFVRVAALGRYLFRYSAIKRNAFPMSDMNLPIPPKSDVFDPWSKKKKKSSKKQKHKSKQTSAERKRPARRSVMDYYAAQDAGKMKGALNTFDGVRGTH